MLDSAMEPAFKGLAVGAELVLLTWLDRARRDVLTTHPRDDVTRPVQGVFNTRSPDRPDPIGLHHVEVAEIRGIRIRVTHLETLNATPILDLKPVLPPPSQR